jgi:serine/threonine protein phosphatase PrpC
MNFIIDIPKKEGFGEDATPINLDVIPERKGVISVFDGLGGSGSVVYKEGEETHTGAYLASRVVRDTTIDFFTNLKDEDCNYKIDSSQLHKYKTLIVKNLNEKLKKQTFETSKLKSSLIRTFPTTLALINYELSDNGVGVDVIWAGDSRAYLLNPKSGLLQLSKDDLKLQNDPFENIERDSPLSNMINLEEDFFLNHLNFHFELPVILLVATDGCFGYYPTPMHFEHAILSSIKNSNSINEMQFSLTEEFKKVTGDDSSMSLTIVNVNDFIGFKSLFLDRFEELYRDYMKDIIAYQSKINELSATKNKIISEIDELEVERKEFNKRCWEKYKVEHYKH